MCKRSHFNTTDVVPLRIEIWQRARRRIERTMRRKHESVRFQELVSRHDNTVQHALMQHIKSHPLGNNNVHRIGQSDVLYFAIDHL